MKSTKEIREKYGMTVKELGDMFDIPVRTIENWEYRGCCPDYVAAMMERSLGLMVKICQHELELEEDVEKRYQKYKNTGEELGEKDEAFGKWMQAETVRDDFRIKFRDEYLTGWEIMRGEKV